MDHITEVTPRTPAQENWRHGVVWRGVERIAMRLSDAHWYGLGALLHQQWPLEKIALPRGKFLTTDNGPTGLLGILEPFWVNSQGFGLWVEGDDIEVGFNAPGGSERPWKEPDARSRPNRERPRFSRGIETDGLLSISGSNLTIYFFLKENARQVVEAYYQRLPPLEPPPARYFERPLWTTWAQFKNDISQEAIEEVVEHAARYEFHPSVFGIDAKWQTEFGDTSFDQRKFPHPRKLIDRLHALDCEVTLWIVPFIMPQSENFDSANAAGAVIKNPDASPYLGKWWEGLSAFIDFNNAAGIDWYLQKLEDLSARTGVDGYKFDAGEAQFYEAAGVSQPNLVAARYLAPLTRRYPWSDARAGWNCQGIQMLFRQWDKKSVWGYDNGLASCVSQALTLNLLGYRFSFPDMIGGNEWHGDRADAEMLMRWTEAVAPMPIIQFSVPPWREGEACARVCARYAALHREIAPLHARLAHEHAPILRPLWWLAPDDPDAQVCDDEYLIGDELLAAPVLEPGSLSRNIYLPRGDWRDYWSGRIYSGNAWLENFPAPLDHLPLFRRV